MVVADRARRSALDLFCGLSLGPPQYLETRFLFAVQALEVYHRRCPWFTQRLMPRDEWRKKRDALLAAVKNDNNSSSGWRNGCPSSRTSPSARPLDRTRRPWRGSCDSVLRDDFINVATQTRHGLTHYDPARKALKAPTSTGSPRSYGVDGGLPAPGSRLAQEEILEATGRTQRTRDLLNQNHKR